MSNVNNILTKEVIFSQLGSTEKFPIDLNHAWKWLQFNSKLEAQEAILNAGFFDGEDYRQIERPIRTKSRPHPKPTFHISIECFKSLAILSPTPKGRLVRLYYMMIEKQWENKNSESVDTYTLGEIAILISWKLDCDIPPGNYLNNFLKDFGYQEKKHQKAPGKKPRLGLTKLGQDHGQQSGVGIRWYESIVDEIIALGFQV